MDYLFAPMEGITGRVYRRVHARFFPGLTAYYAPFFSPSGDHHFPLRGLIDLLPEENPGVSLVPQLLTRRAEDFIWASAALMDRGYREVNLNLGCPSGTVVAKGKGAGFLRTPEDLDAFFDKVFSAPALDGLEISVKARIGYADVSEFPALLKLFRRYPLGKLILHPRLKTDGYSGPVRPDVFRLAAEDASHPPVWNGDLFTPADVKALQGLFPGIGAVMLGRGLVAEPGLVRRLKTGEACDRETLRAFHGAMAEEYRAVLYGDTAFCHRMKELWSYLILHFEGGEKHYKRLTKAKTASEFLLAAEAVFAELPLLPDARWEGGLSKLKKEN